MEGFVYFAEDDEHTMIKVGWSGDPSARLRTLQKSFRSSVRMIAIVPGSRADEAAYLASYSKYPLAAGREWFVWHAQLSRHVSLLRSLPLGHFQGICRHGRIPGDCSLCGHEMDALILATDHVAERIAAFVISELNPMPDWLRLGILVNAFDRLFKIRTVAPSPWREQVRSKAEGKS